jgi:acetylornithine deacetylase/succinyl-diaminopimelate desuccinylase-like protein
MPRLPAHLQDAFRQTLARFVAIPSVGAEGRGQSEMADALAHEFRSLGLHVERHETAGAPVVFAERRVPGAPTVLFYNHYDVQPADGLELWESDPFTLTERDGKLYGRGASDDKGQLVSRLVALRWLRERHGELPFGVVFAVEGEEEIGSPHVAEYVAMHRARLAADVAVWEFGGVDARDRPLLTCGLKGVVGIDLALRTAAADLHSGNGAVVQNAAWRLAAAVAGLRDVDGRVLIDGFYDAVRPTTDAERRRIEEKPRDDDAFGASIGVTRFLGGAIGAAFERRLQLEPALNVNGFHSGYGGPGMKTVLPATATAKLDIRLVPDQDPLHVVELLRAHLVRHGFDDVDVSVPEDVGLPARIDPDHPWLRHVQDALAEAYGQPAVVVVSSGASGPLHPFAVTLGLPVAMIGVAYPGSGVHGPNEHVRLSDVERGTFALVRALERWAGLTPPG